jgi:hypothetical protein
MQALRDIAANLRRPGAKSIVDELEFGETIRDDWRAWR